MINKAAFSLQKYTFNKVVIDFDSNNLPELELDFKPSGVFKQLDNGSVFELKFVFFSKGQRWLSSVCKHRMQFFFQICQ